MVHSQMIKYDASLYSTHSLLVVKTVGLSVPLSVPCVIPTVCKI